MVLEKGEFMRIMSVFAAVTIILAFGSAAGAAVIFDTLAGTGSDPGASEIFKESWMGQSFITDASYTLESVVLGMSDKYPAGVVDNKFVVRLYAADGPDSVPGTLLLTFSGSDSPATAGNYTYTGTYNLIANTTYWVVAEDTGVNTYPYHWNYDYDFIPTPASIGYSGYSPDGSGLLPYWHAPAETGRYYLMQVNAIPEPVSIGLLAIGSFALIRRKK